MYLDTYVCIDVSISYELTVNECRGVYKQNNEMKKKTRNMW